uniref:Transcription factor CBF/NF-Y/archaeal histone domain-containing protein n=1 Tax=Ananas comosus var. bracteatus TaxID=296719 RepID=A0A6V7NG92_ANACO|nr:unnamed protein product [Ananas comosus var. bracteatus]
MDIGLSRDGGRSGEPRRRREPRERGDGSPRSNVREQDRFLPIANLSRIMKKGIPANGKIAKEAKETVQECVSEFISFVTSEASDKCQREKRKTINGDDLLWAMATLGFEDYIEPLKLYLQKYRESNYTSIFLVHVFRLDNCSSWRGIVSWVLRAEMALLRKMGGSSAWWGSARLKHPRAESTRTLQSRHELHATSVTGGGSLFAEGAELLGHSYQARTDPTSMAFASVLHCTLVLVYKPGPSKPINASKPRLLVILTRGAHVGLRCSQSRNRISVLPSRPRVHHP